MKTKTILSVLVLLAIAFTLTSYPCLSAVPSLINYQGVLKDSTGVPYHGNATMVFSIWDHSTDGNKLWEETQAIVSVSHGLFNVLLGSSVSLPDSVFAQPNSWLQVIVNGSLLSPRRRIVSAGYALTDGDWTIDGDNIYREQGNIGIGTVSTEAKLEVAQFLVYAGSTGIRVTNTDSANDGGAAFETFHGGRAWLKIGPRGNIELWGLDNTLSVYLHPWGASYFKYGVGIGTTSPQGALDVSSTTGGFIVPRMTTEQRDQLAAVNGMIIYNSTTNQFNFRENGVWVTK